MVTKITIMNMKTKHFFFLAFVLTFIGTQKMNAQNTFVDLGLPSGTLWATCNVGAISPEQKGDFFAWGETKTNSSYEWSGYSYSNAKSLTKYCTKSSYGSNGFTDGLTELLPEDDAATANWGAEWQMPSIVQFEELMNDEYTIKESTTQNGTNGMRITSKSNAHSIFLPISGYMDGTEIKTKVRGYYWSRSVDVLVPDKGNSIFITESATVNLHSYQRCYGMNVRPVRVQEAHTISDIPDGWKVNGSTTNGTYQAKGGDVLHFTPKNIPAGKRVKSIKVVKK